MIKRKRTSWSSGFSSLWDNDTDFHHRKKREQLTCLLSISPKRLLGFKRHTFVKLSTCHSSLELDWTRVSSSLDFEHSLPVPQKKVNTLCLGLGCLTLVCANAIQTPLWCLKFSYIDHNRFSEIVMPNCTYKYNQFVDQSCPIIND